MIWPICGALALLALSFPVALLVHRKFRQAKLAARLHIKSPIGIAEESFVPIGGISQWISIRGEDRNNPVLFVLHGGPGSSYSIFTPLLRAWEKHFTIVQWDQRGAGKTFARTGPRGSGSITMAQLASDGIELAEFLRRRLGKDRLLLLASSFGSTFGLQMARTRSDLFYAYIGTDQNVGTGPNREHARSKLIQRLRAAGMKKGLKSVERIGSDPTRWTARDFHALTQWMMKSDRRGYRRTIKLLKDAVWYAPGWTLRDIRAFVAGMKFSLEQLLPEFARYDPWQHGTRFEIPFFIFHGEEDVLTDPELARCYYNDVIAPHKEMRLIAGAGHFAAFLQPAQFLDLLLARVRPLAVAPTAQETMVN